jgi:hypothetical protein
MRRTARFSKVSSRQNATAGALAQEATDSTVPPRPGLLRRRREPDVADAANF